MSRGRSGSASPRPAPDESAVAGDGRMQVLDARLLKEPFDLVLQRREAADRPPFGAGAGNQADAAGQLRARVDGVLVDGHLGHEVFDRVADDDDVPAAQGMDGLDARALVEILRLTPAVGQFEPCQAERLVDEHASVGLACRHEAAQARLAPNHQRTGRKRNQTNDCVHECPCTPGDS